MKVGNKSIVFSDATNVYVKKIQVHAGKDERNVSGIVLCSRVVLNLLQNYQIVVCTCIPIIFTQALHFPTTNARGINAHVTARAGCKTLHSGFHSTCYDQ